MTTRNKFFNSILGVLFFAPILASAQPDFTPMINAIQNGSASTLSNYFDKNVEITVLDKDDQYDKASATRVVTDFFNSNKPSACSIVHKGVSDDKTSYYAIGSLSAGTKTFRVYIYVKNNGSQYLIQELRFEKG